MCQDICVCRADPAGCMSDARFPLFGISTGWVLLLFYQDIQRISFHVLRYTLVILLSLLVACENCCSFWQLPWHDLSSYGLWGQNSMFRSASYCWRITILLQLIPNILWHSAWETSSQVLRCDVLRIEQFALEDRLLMNIRRPSLDRSQLTRNVPCGTVSI